MNGLKKKPSKDNLEEIAIHMGNGGGGDYASSANHSDGYESSINIISPSLSAYSSVNTSAVSSLATSPSLGSVQQQKLHNQHSAGNFKTTPQHKFHDTLIQLLGVDLRSLAAMRIGLAILIILDLYVRSLYLYDHYSDLGVLPASVVIDNNPYYWSLYFINPSYFFACTLFVVNWILAFGFLIGYKTFWTNLLCWVFMTSLHVRNPFVLNGGDDFFRLFVFWSIFLPLGAKFSIDAILNVEHLNNKANILNPKAVTYSPVISTNKLFPTTDSEGKYFFGFGSMAIQAQFLLVYIITAALKTGAEWNTEYSAVWYALHLEQFTTPLGNYLRPFVQLGVFLTWFSIYFEWYGVLLFYIPVKSLHGPLRTLGVIGFWCMHIGFGSCLRLGFFKYIPGMCVLVFLPKWFWDNLFNWLYTNTSKTSYIIYVNSNNDSVQRALNIYKQFFLLHSTPIIMAHRQDEDSLDGQKSMYQDMKENNAWIAVENGINGETVFSYNAFLQLIALSPILQYTHFIFRSAIFKKLYLYTTTKQFFTNGTMFKATNKIYPTSAYTCSRKWYTEIFLWLLLFFVINWNLAGLYHYSVPQNIRWVASSFKVEQYWSMFSPYPSKDNGWLVYPGILKNGTEVDIVTKLPVTFNKPEVISDTFPTQRWRKYLMNLEGSNLKEKRLHYGRYLCREWNWFGRNPGDAQLKSFKMIYMMQMTPQFPTDLSQPLPTFDPPQVVELWSHIC
ncbi:hypothetical protein CYY_009282 [Polysphondylium violaceum]|uniref:HTTM-like domain-containing protein n=1 Tax=Polysphondylium violaceum TaxID=133409 RepID=A0A8J4PLY9_9MYCE|nr:hypothetical protein CYY_009282 [Polysphondylium violaceum]